jgi:hypothetical protein
LLIWRVLHILSRSAPGHAPQALSSAASGAEDNPSTAYESSDWPLAPVGLILLATLVLIVISSFAVIIAYPNTIPDVGRTLRIAPPGPRLQTNPAADYARFRDQEKQRLNTYYWVDKQKGIVHVPILEAMKKLASTGAPGFPKGAQ